MSDGPMKVRITRRVAFSSGHRYWLTSKSDEENRDLFGRWASKFNHGHNYVLDVTVEGEVDPRTGMVVNIKRIDDVLQEKIVQAFDQKSLNDEVDYFAKWAPSVENILTYVQELLSAPGTLPGECALVALKLEEMPTFYGELELGGKMSLTRVYEFAASHRLHSPALSDEENLELFGKCNNPAGHGHNYVLEVTVAGVPDPVTGMLTDLGAVDEVVRREVVDRYDHKNLNEDLPEFEGKTTTSEVVAAQIFSTLKGKVPGQLARIRLHETARNSFEVSA